MRGAGLAAVLAVGLGAAACAEAPAAVNAKRDGPEAWAARYAPPDARWMRVAWSDEGPIFLDRSIDRRRYPRLRYRIKYENFEPTRVAGHVFQSTAAWFEVDCAALSHRIIGLRAYADLGLNGDSFEAANPLPDWSEPQIGSDGYRFSAMACALAAPATYDLSGDPVVRWETPVRTPDDVAAATWVRRSGPVGADWTYVGADPLAAHFLSDRDFEFGRYPSIRFTARTEFFQPNLFGEAAVSSERLRIEAACDRKMHRTLTAERYGEPDLAGAASTDEFASSWSNNGVRSTYASAACTLAARLREIYGNRAPPSGRDLF